jgi:hypothetical protein
LVEERVVIERKTGRTIEVLDAEGEIGRWRAALEEACRQLRAPRYVGLVADYDGTLCRPEDRFGPLPKDVASQLVRLLRADVVVGIASGRGKSVRQSLQQAIPRRYWARVIVGYYNGSDVGLLNDDDAPDGRAEAGLELRSVADALSCIASQAEVAVRPRQITLSPRGRVSVDALWCRVQTVVAARTPGVAVLRSSHSVDVVAPGVSKMAVVDGVRVVCGRPDGFVLCLGDRGRWPGNDFALLDSPHALSVDEVSPHSESAWNLAPAGLRGEQACLAYLQCCRPGRGGFTFETQAGGDGR